MQSAYRMHHSTETALLRVGNDIPLAPIVRRSDSAIHWINLYPVDNAIRFAITYPLDSDLSVG